MRSSASTSSRAATSGAVSVHEFDVDVEYGSGTAAAGTAFAAVAPPPAAAALHSASAADGGDGGADEEGGVFDPLARHMPQLALFLRLTWAWTMVDEADDGGGDDEPENDGGGGGGSGGGGSSQLLKGAAATAVATEAAAAGAAAAAAVMRQRRRRRALLAPGGVGRCLQRLRIGRKIALVWCVANLVPLIFWLLSYGTPQFRAIFGATTIIHTVVAASILPTPFMLDVLAFLRPLLNRIFAAGLLDVLQPFRARLRSQGRAVLAYLVVGCSGVVVAWAFVLLPPLPPIDRGAILFDALQFYFLPLWLLVYVLGVAIYTPLVFCMTVHEASIEIFFRSLNRRAVEPLLLAAPPSATRRRFDWASYTIFSSDELRLGISAASGGSGGIGGISGGAADSSVSAAGLHLFVDELQNLRAGLRWSSSFWQHWVAAFFYTTFLVLLFWVYVSAVSPGSISAVVYSLGFPLLVSLVFAPFARVNDAWLAHVDSCTLARSPFDAHERTYLLGLLRTIPAQMSLHGFVLTTRRLRALILFLYCLALYCLARYLAFYGYT